MTTTYTLHEVEALASQELFDLAHYAAGSARVYGSSKATEIIERADIFGEMKVEEEATVEHIGGSVYRVLDSDLVVVLPGTPGQFTTHAHNELG